MAEQRREWGVTANLYGCLFGVMQMLSQILKVSGYLQM